MKRSSYPQLSCYLTPNPIMAPAREGTKSGVFMTPNYSPPTYDALTHGVKDSKSYFNIQQAYGPITDTSYTSRLYGNECNTKYTTPVVNGVGVGMAVRR